MRKFILFVIIILFIITLVDNKKDEEIRVRIIPNSNSGYDIDIKNEVKDSVIYYLYNIYDESYDKYKNNINESVEDLEIIISRQFYRCKVEFDYHTLYNKTYNGNKVKDKETLVLLIVIGDGKGDNWWGSVYPKYLGVSGSSEIKYESLFKVLVDRIRGKNDEN